MPQRYSASLYNFRVTMDDGRLGLYNSRTGSLVVFDRDESDDVARLLHDPQRPHKFREDMVRQGFLVLSGEDETAAVRALNLEWLNDRHVVHVTMLPAEACNFSCP